MKYTVELYANGESQVVKKLKAEQVMILTELIKSF